MREGYDIIKTLSCLPFDVRGNHFPRCTKDLIFLGSPCARNWGWCTRMMKKAAPPCVLLQLTRIICIYYWRILCITGVRYHSTSEGCPPPALNDTSSLEVFTTLFLANEYCDDFVLQFNYFACMSMRVRLKLGQMMNCVHNENWCTRSREFWAPCRIVTYCELGLISGTPLRDFSAASCHE
jgi:hypothetical protein